MKISVLNECFLSDENLSYLRSLGPVETYKNTTDEVTAIARMAGSDIVLADMFECPLRADVLNKSTSVKLLCVNSTAFHLVALDVARSKNILVANTPDYSTDAVAEHAFALLLAVIRRIVDADAAVRVKPFETIPGVDAHHKYRGFNLTGKTIGIIGLGAIGTRAAQIAQGFGMYVLGCNPSPRSIGGIEMVSLDELFARADIISLHAPLNDTTRGLINSAAIAKMKDGVVIINTASGGCIVSNDLANALQSGKVKAAGLDVLESWTSDNPLLTAPNTLITPHSGWLTKETEEKIGDIMTDNVRAFVEGKPQNIVS